jgi:hypothetical protein
MASGVGHERLPAGTRLQTEETNTICVEVAGRRTPRVQGTGYRHWPLASSSAAPSISKYHITVEFVLHRKHASPQLQSPTG